VLAVHPLEKCKQHHSFFLVGQATRHSEYPLMQSNCMANALDGIQPREWRLQHQRLLSKDQPMRQFAYPTEQLYSAPAVVVVLVQPGPPCSQPCDDIIPLGGGLVKMVDDGHRLPKFLQHQAVLSSDHVELTAPQS